MNYITFGGHQVSKVIKGNWQLAGGHGLVDRQQAISDLFSYAGHGVNTFDTGDIYGESESILGEFLLAYRQRYGDRVEELRVHTKFVPDLDALEDLTRQDVRKVIERSLQRLGLQRLHLVQFHWWDYQKGDFVQAARYLEELRQEGLIELIGLTNFDCAHTRLLLDAGVQVASNQIQFSLLDPRPLRGMLQLAQEQGMALFCYGVLAGGLLTSTQMSGEIGNRSRIKYGLMIEEVGQDHYHDVLKQLESLAEKYQTTMANICMAFALRTPGVSGVILGPRNASHLAELNALDKLPFEEQDYQQLYHLMANLQLTGDIYSFERDIKSSHAQAMKYNLNGMRS